MGHAEHMAVAARIVDEAMPDVDRMRITLQALVAEASEALRTYKLRRKDQIALSAWTVYDLATLALEPGSRSRRRHRMAEIAAGRP